MAIGDVSTIVTGTTPPSKENDNWGVAVPFLTPSDFGAMEFAPTTERCLSEVAARRARSKIISAPGVAVVCIGATIGKVARISTPTLTNQQINTIVPDETLLDADFTFYLFAGLAQHLRSVASGSATPLLNKSQFSQVEILLPSIDEQKGIATVLASLDRLVALNRSLISNLIAMVDAGFEKAFGESPLALRIGDICRVVDCLHSKKPERLDSGRLLLQLNNIRDDGTLDLADRFYIGDSDFDKWSKNLETKPWDVVITNVGRVGAVARIPHDVGAALGRNMTAIRPMDSDSDGAFVLGALRSERMSAEIQDKTDMGTVMDALNVKSIPELRMPAAEVTERRGFHDRYGPMLVMADSLVSESLEVARARDELRPLLLSGALRVGKGTA